MYLLSKNQIEISVLDKILDRFFENRIETFPLNTRDIIKLLPEINERDVYLLVSEIYLEGYIDHLFDTIGKVGQYAYKINPKGANLKRNGGFDRYYKKQIYEQEQAIKRIDLEEKQIQSVIDTNDTVKKSSKITLWVAGLAVFISLISLAKDLLKSDTLQVSPLTQTDSILKNTEKRIDSVNQTLQKIDSSIKNLKNASK